MRMCRLCAFERNDDDAERCRQCGADMAPAEEEEADLGEAASEEVLALLQRAVTAQNDLQEICEKNLDRLRALEQRVTSALRKRSLTARPHAVADRRGRSAHAQPLLLAGWRP